jgi:3-oxoacyl-[acyl-carrier protein] reductase
MPTPDRFLVTGCGSGIGRHLADEIVRRGHRLLATDAALEALERHAEAAAWPADRVRCEGLDVRDPAAWERLTALAEELWGGLDVVINVAGILQPAAVVDAGDDDVHRHFDVNVKGVVFGTRAAARSMIRQGFGHVVNVASLASLAPIPGIALYSASKYAVRAYSLAAAEELRPHGVAVTTICPDAVRTPMLDRQIAHPEAALTFSAPRFLTVEEVARVILGRVLRKRPLLVAIPRWRGWLARVADLFPSASKSLTPIFTRRGRRRQESLQRTGES